jgi:V8-like Glu-specific endopeptidase
MTAGTTTHPRHRFAVAAVLAAPRSSRWWQSRWQARRRVPTSSGRRRATTRRPRAAGGQLAPSQISAIYAQASSGVVSVHVSSGSGTASGTGFVFDRDGTIVTNAHVVGDAQEAQVRFDDDAPVQATVVGTDPSSDLAVLHVDPAQAGTLHPLTLAESDNVRVGDTAIAVGYPFGLDRTATAGIVSGLGRRIQAPNGVSIEEVIQTDAPINPGNSGGPLLDARGRVIGVNSQIATASGGGGNVGVGLGPSPGPTARRPPSRPIPRPCARSPRAPAQRRSRSPTPTSSTASTSTSALGSARARSSARSARPSPPEASRSCSAGWAPGCACAAAWPDAASQSGEGVDGVLSQELNLVLLRLSGRDLLCQLGHHCRVA